MAWICGVEEAGRGPVLGPMVMACCWVEEKNEKLLIEAGAKDSKQLSAMQREGFLERAQKLKKEKKINFEIIILPPTEIDAAVDTKNDNLNKLELRTTAKLINKALQKNAIKKALIDCPAKNTEKYAADIAALLNKKMTVIAEHKADENYPVVSAASIIAKVTRDKEIENIQKKIKKSIGSGYPADPITQDFLRNNYKKKEYKDFFRTSWASYKELVEQGKQSRLFQFSGKAQEEHAKELKEFEFLKEHGFEFQAPKSQYEVVRMKSSDASIIKYTTGKLVIQGKGKARVEKLVARKSQKS